MTAAPAVPARRTALGAVLVLAGLLSTTGCATLGLEHPPVAPHPTPTVDKPSKGPRTGPAKGGSALSAAQAHAALITESDLGPPWAATRGAATWRDGMLKATTTARECQRLLDTLYTDELLGGPARTAVGLDDADTGAQLRFQIGARRPAEVDRELAWLKTMPQKCARFGAKTGRGAVLDVRVGEAPLPEVGDARQGLRVTVASAPAGADSAEPVVLTLDVAAVRVGEDSFALTNGGLGDVANEATQAAVQLGALRLADVRKQGRAEV